MSRTVDMVGRKYGKLTVIKQVASTKRGIAQWLCECECGKQCVATGDNLRRGRQVSCGCYRTNLRSSNDVPTALRQTRLYRIWQRMLIRCNDPKSISYPNYGARGIKVCDEWAKDFMPFYDWAMNNGYEDDLTIDRIDNDGNYEPSNCRWATYTQQAQNKSTNVSISYNGETKCVTEWGRELGVSPKTLFWRLSAGWADPKEILFGRTRKRGFVNG